MPKTYVHNFIESQTNIEMISVETQCNLGAQSSYSTCSTSDASSQISSNDDEEMSDFEPSSEEEVDDGSSTGNSKSTTHKHRFYLVEESKLLELCSRCPECGGPALPSTDQIVGSMVKINRFCGNCGVDSQFHSQPKAGDIPLGNILISLAILLSGSLVAKSIRMFEAMGMAAINARTYHRHQRFLLNPCVDDQWTTTKKKLLDGITNTAKGITISGDGRCDTPGHNAKFCSYTIMDSHTSKIIDAQLIQSNEVANSNCMEKEGLRRGIAELTTHDVKIESIVTDRHPQIIKFVRENMPETTHEIDTWHVAKTLKKKLLALSNQPDCDPLRCWLKSIINHLYWVAATSKGNSSQLKWEKFISIMNHVQNVHVDHGLEFKECLHGELGDHQQKAWLQGGLITLRY